MKKMYYTFQGSQCACGYGDIHNEPYHLIVIMIKLIHVQGVINKYVGEWEQLVYMHVG